MKILCLALLATLSRIICFLLVFLWSIMFRQVSFNTSSILLIPPEPALMLRQRTSATWQWFLIQPFLRWDAEYFISIANLNLYKADFHHAFLPGFSIILRFICRILLLSPTNILHVAYIGYLVSNVSFIIAAIGIAILSKLLLLQVHEFISIGASLPINTNSKESSKMHGTSNCVNTVSTSVQWETTAKSRYHHKKKINVSTEIPLAKNQFSINDALKYDRVNTQACIASILFIINPGNIFMSAVYSESIFSCTVIWGFVLFILCELSLRPLSNITQHYRSLSTIELSVLQLFHRSYIYRTLGVIVATIFLTLSTLIRSNGITTLFPVFFATLRTCPLCQLWNPLHCKTNMNTSKRIFILSIVSHWFTSFIIAVIISSPLLAVMGFAYRIYCSTPIAADSIIQPFIQTDDCTVISFESQFFKNILLMIQVVLTRCCFKNSLVVAPSQSLSWCSATIPSIYGFIQRTYWNVRLFHYWSISKLDRFIYSFPFYMMSLYILIYITGYKIFNSKKKLNIFSRIQHVLSSPLLGYWLQLLFMTVYIGCIANVEVFIRLLSGCPFYFTYLGVLIEKKLINNKKTTASHLLDVALKGYLFFHFFCHLIGPLFFCSWMTWT